MGKTIVCRCEDVSIEDLRVAFEAGYHDLESLKRYTGFSTGFCQGKTCTVHAARFLASLKGGDDVVSDPTRPRPLLHPTPVARFTGMVDQSPPDSGTGATASDKEKQ